MEGCEKQKSLCTSPNCWIKVANGCYLRFHSSTSEWTSESDRELDETATGFTAVHRLKISQLWCPRKRTLTLGKQ